MIYCNNEVFYGVEHICSSLNRSPTVRDQERNGPYVGIFGTLKVTLLVVIMSTSWLHFIQLHASVGVLLAIAGTYILSLTKEDNMIKTIAKAIILTVGTALLGRHISNFRAESAL